MSTTRRSPELPVVVARSGASCDGLAELGVAVSSSPAPARLEALVDDLRHLRLTGVVRELVVHPGRLRLVVGPHRADPSLGDDGVVDDQLDPPGEHLVADLARGDLDRHVVVARSSHHAPVG